MNPYNQQPPLFPTPPQPQNNNQHLFFATTPPPSNYLTQSWLELNLLGQALSLRLIVGTQEIVVVLQDPIYLSQVVTEAPGMTIANLTHFPWMLNTPPLPNVMNPNNFFFPANNYPAWEIPSYLSPLIYPLTNEIPFFPTTTLNSQMHTPLFTPWTFPYQNPNYPSQPFMAAPVHPPPYFQSFHFQNQASTSQAPPPPPPPPTPPQEQDHVVSDLPNSTELAAILQNHRETSTEIYVLRELCALIFQERGGNSAEFRHNFRALIDWHRPSIITLLETKMEEHQPILNDFPFTNMIQLPAQGLSRGIVILWDANILELTQIEVTNQTIHVKVQVVVAPPGEPVD
ncbi:hypothetical protein HAX54_023720 [Datura stramonium]|uniref:Uncharacterized protein n=1 Tax=Datura stramonium TaxID=4076 RepID=A0ABS8UZ57_DATST|nr:hypothetical protein [Datura stramonium]